MIRPEDKRRPCRNNSQELKLAANGRWMEILSSIGIPMERLNGRGHACPRCGGRDRFAAFRDVDERGGVICRKCHPNGGDGIATVMWWLDCDFRTALKAVADAIGGQFVPEARTRPVPHTAETPPSQRKPIDHERWTSKAESYAKNLDEPDLQAIADHLGVSFSALWSLGVGWRPEDPDRPLTFPMRDARGRVIGIRTRRYRSNVAPKVKSIAGSTSGLFVPPMMNFSLGDMLVCEGESDTAAALTIGMAAIGIPGTGQCSHLVAEFCSIHQPPRVIVIADNDEAGLGGATKLAQSLHWRSVVIRRPSDANDLRDALVAATEDSNE